MLSRQNTKEFLHLITGQTYLNKKILNWRKVWQSERLTEMGEWKTDGTPKSTIRWELQ
jgi:hypothetical protein